MSKSQILKGIRWTLITSVIRRLIALVLFYFIAKWLTKDDLGVFREYSLILGLASVISTLSLDYQYIIEPKKVRTGLLSLMQVSLLGSLLGVIVLSVCSGLLGRLYGSSSLSNIISITVIFIIAENIRRTTRAVAARNKQFRELALAETYNVVFYSILSLVALYFYKSVLLYLVIFYLGNTLEAVYLWKLNSKTLNRTFRQAFRRWKVLAATLSRFKDFLTKATLFSVINQISGNAPVLILGMFLEPVYVGLYFFASQLIGVPIGMFNASVNQVVFPVIAERSDENIAAMADRYLRLVGSLALPLLLMFCFVMMHGVYWLLGDKWGEAVPLLPAMFLLYGSSLYSNIVSGLTFIRRKPGLALGWTTVSLILRSAAMLAGLTVSFNMAIMAFAVMGAVMNLSLNLISLQLIGIRLRTSLRAVLLSLIPSLFFSLLMIAVSRLDAIWAVLASVIICIILIGVLDVIHKGKIRADVKSMLNLG